MSLEEDTKESFARLAERVANDEIEILVALGGVTKEDEDGDVVGVYATNIADGDGDQMVQLIERFLEPLVQRNPKAGAFLAVSVLQTLIKTRYDVDADYDFLGDQVLKIFERHKPPSIYL